jgi:hypothetical protein
MSELPSPRTPRQTLTKAPAQAGEEATSIELADTRCCGFLRTAKIPAWLPAKLPSLPGMSAVLVQATYAIFTTIVTARGTHFARSGCPCHAGTPRRRLVG